MYPAYRCEATSQCITSVCSFCHGRCIDKRHVDTCSIVVDALSSQRAAFQQKLHLRQDVALGWRQISLWIAAARCLPRLSSWRVWMPRVRPQPAALGSSAALGIHLVGTTAAPRCANSARRVGTRYVKCCTYGSLTRRPSSLPCHSGWRPSFGLDNTLIWSYSFVKRHSFLRCSESQERLLSLAAESAAFKGNWFNMYLDRRRPHLHGYLCWPFSCWSIANAEVHAFDTQHDGESALTFSQLRQGLPKAESFKRHELGCSARPFLGGVPGRCTKKKKNLQTQVCQMQGKPSASRAPDTALC